MPRPPKPPSQRLAARVSRARAALALDRRRLYLAAYEANQGGWSDRALGVELGVPHTTVQHWREAGQRISEQNPGE